MDEKKVYSIVGTVTIGTDEYRDLIEGKVAAEKESSDYCHRYWEEQTKNRKLEEENAKLREELDKYKKFVKDNGEQDKMELWILKLSRED